MIKQHPLIQTLLNLRGNSKASVLTEPLWGIPFFLYAPYVSVYMSKLGMKDSQIGLLLSIGMVMQFASALLSGPITDKLGRRKTTFIFDLISWSIPTLILALAQNIWFFLIAAIFNGVWRVTHTSWSCLLVEDADPDELMDIYSWIYIGGQMSAIFAPIAIVLVNRFEVVATVRWLYIFACIMMTIKFIILYVYSTETKQGEVRMQETRGKSLFSLVGGYKDIIPQVLRTPRTLFTLGIMLFFGTASTINSAFFGLMVTQKLEVADSSLTVFSFLRSVIMLIFFFLVMPRIRELRFRNPMLIGFSLLVIGQIIIITAPEKLLAPLLVSTFLEACAFATVSTQVDRMIVVTVDPQERARISALLYVSVIAFSAPFGWISGGLSEINRTLPFVLNIGLYSIAALFTFLAARRENREESSAQEVVSVS